MQDLAISGTSEFQHFPRGSRPRTPLIIVLEDEITRGLKLSLVLGTQIPWEYQLQPGYTLL
jgi:hypothetical protein